MNMTDVVKMKTAANAGCGKLTVITHMGETL
jgi:hypothetical protein